MEFLNEYGVFLAKAVTIVVAILFIIAAATSAAMKNKKAHDKEMLVEKINDSLADAKKDLEEHVLNKELLKAKLKEEKKKEKKKSKDKNQEEPIKPRVFVLTFDGDIKASAVDTFRDAITAVLQLADPQHDEVVVKLESAGGMVHSYGLAAAQMDRIKGKGIKLTACVDKVAASGGYMMACVADQIIASPFAIMGSIGVVAQLPNFHKLLKKHDIDFEIMTAGEYKRTLTMFGENTEKGRHKFQADLEDTHELFKAYVAERRPVVDIDKVANGDIWFGSRAQEVALVDKLQTSDDYLVDACNDKDVFSVDYKLKQTLADKLGIAVSSGIESALYRVINQFNVSRGIK